MKGTKRHVLICGASVAGPCVAYWLNRAGFRTTVIERAPRFREGGQNIDISGAAQKIADLMGLLGAIKEKNTSEIGLRFVDGAGRVVAEFPKNGDDSFTSEYEIRRGDLSKIFYEATKDQTEYRFGTSIQSLQDDTDAIRATLSNGSTEEFDLIVCAEGVGSPTRKLVFDTEVTLKYLGIWMGYFRIPRVASDDRWCRWYNALGGRVIMVRPSTSDSVAVTVAYLSDISESDPLSIEMRRDAIKKFLKDAGWASPRILANIEFDNDIYLGPISQVKASQWSKGRFVLLGDAAYGPSPITGMGTTLAIIGAYMLADEIASGQDLTASLQSYERQLRPYVEEVQELPPGVPRLVYPNTRFGVAMIRTGARVFASAPIQAIKNILKRKDKREDKRGRKNSNEFVLPDYEDYFARKSEAQEAFAKAAAKASVEAAMQTSV